MAPSDKNPLKSVGSPTGDDHEEIDRIMQEIENLEKKMDESTSGPEASATPAEASSEGSGSVESSSPEESVEPSGEEAGGKVIAFRGQSGGESMAETDAVPASNEPLMRGVSDPEGGLSLRVGGAAEVTLEFSKAGVTVSLACTDEGLTISTDQGAEFRIPFRRAA